ncbi:MAG: response regulator [Deltaproteobacteria bacterium]|nr:response regulator [Deltaproteobacteria bacterium]
MTSQPGSLNAGPPKNICIADDDAFFRTILKDILTSAGHNVLGVAEDGAAAVVMAKELKPEIFILDLVMPEMNGIEALREMKLMPTPPKVILCTTIKGEKVLAEAKAAGIDGYVKKPFNEEEILGTIAGL